MKDAVCVSAGVDWITGVANDDISALKLAAIGHDLFYFETQRGNLKKGWGMAGFSGFKCGEVELGFRNHEVIVRLMSDVAQNCWRGVYEASDSITRIDLQYTIDIKREVQPTILKLYQQANEKSLERKRGPTNRVTFGNDGGATLYCGVRQSDVFGRIYAKGPQSKDSYYETCMRLEVQFQRKLAQIVSRAVAKSTDIARTAIESSDAFFSKRIRNFSPHTAGVVNYSCSRKTSNLQQRLKWLCESVKPSVKLLIDHNELAATIEALGLTDYVSVNSTLDSQKKCA